MVSRDYQESGQAEDACPRCGAGRLRVWYELTDEEREVVKRLPASTGVTLEERAASNLWCAKCWFEDATGRPRNA